MTKCTCRLPRSGTATSTTSDRTRRVIGDGLMVLGGVLIGAPLADAASWLHWSLAGAGGLLVFAGLYIREWSRSA